jgi:hypothetical protein
MHALRASVDVGPDGFPDAADPVAINDALDRGK